MEEICKNGNIYACLIDEYSYVFVLLIGLFIMYCIMSMLEVGIHKLSVLIKEFREVISGRWNVMSLNGFFFVVSVLFVLFTFISDKISKFAFHFLFALQNGNEMLPKTQDTYILTIVCFLMIYIFGISSISIVSFVEKRKNNSL